jgi:hypothetical protein
MNPVICRLGLAYHTGLDGDRLVVVGYGSRYMNSAIDQAPIEMLLDIQRQDITSAQPYIFFSHLECGVVKPIFYGTGRRMVLPRSSLRG